MNFLMKEKIMTFGAQTASRFDSSCSVFQHNQNISFVFFPKFPNYQRRLIFARFDPLATTIENFSSVSEPFDFWGRFPRKSDCQFGFCVFGQRKWFFQAFQKSRRFRFWIILKVKIFNQSWDQCESYINFLNFILIFFINISAYPS